MENTDLNGGISNESPIGDSFSESIVYIGTSPGLANGTKFPVCGPRHYGFAARPRGETYPKEKSKPRAAAHAFGNVVGPRNGSALMAVVAMVEIRGLSSPSNTMRSANGYVASSVLGSIRRRKN